MKVSDILRLKGNTLYTVHPDEPLARAVETMAEKGHRLAGGHGAWRPGGHADLFREVPDGLEMDSYPGLVTQVLEQLVDQCPGDAASISKARV